MFEHLPSISWLLPLAGALVLLVVPNSDGRNNSLIRWLALVISIAGFAVTLAMWARFDETSADFQMVERVKWIHIPPTLAIDYYVGIDGISLLLVVLTAFLTPIALLSSWEGIDKKVKEFSILILVLDAAMIGVFISLDLFLFYVFWDAMLIPMYFLIGIWGYDQRIYAAVKFMLYTMAGSVLMLIAILALAYMYSEGRDRGATASSC
jgi:NADH-quinone oxidoreductase subunit M